MTRQGQSAARRGALALVMLAVLVGSVAAAWWYTRSVQRRARAGAEILQVIRSRGLAEFWPEEFRTDWYLIDSGGDIIGYRAAARGTAGGGQFAGVLLAVRGPADMAVEQWLLNADATRGQYEAYATAGQRGRGQTFDTLITLQDDPDERGRVVIVLQSSLRLQATAAEPPNYLPEGTVELAVRLVAERRADALFKMVFNDVPNLGGKVRFGNVRLRYAGSAAGRDGKPVTRVEASLVERGSSVRYEVDASGEILSGTTPHGGWHRADAESVARRFPDAPAAFRRWLPRLLRGAAGEGLQEEDDSPALDGLGVPRPEFLGPLDQFLLRRLNQFRQREVRGPPVPVRPRR